MLIKMDENFVIVVDDEPEIVNTLSIFLTDRGYRVKSAYNATALFAILKRKTPNLIILDIKLPDMNGFEICKKLKTEKKLSSIPVIFLSANNGESDKISGLDLGADDYVSKPFSLQELNARIKAVLRRNGKIETQAKKINVSKDLVIDFDKCEVLACGRKVNLTNAEFRILEFLSAKKGRVFSREQILDYLWGEEKIVVARTIDVHIRHLREKLEKCGNYIKNVRGFGYKLDTEEDLA